MKRALVTVAALAGVIAAAAPSTQLGAAAQTPSAGPGGPAFEVASVRRNRSNDGRVTMQVLPGGRFTASNVPLALLIRFSYQLQPFQVVGGPDWLNTDRFDVTAKAEGDIQPTPPGTTGQLQLMMRALLADRFRLVTHGETREMPIYNLVLARSDSRLGSGLKPSSTDCAAVMRGRRGGGPPPAPPQPGEPIQCGLMIGIGTMNAGGMPMSQLAQTLSQQVGRIVTDRTGLTGNYDFMLTYAPEGRGGPPGGPPFGGPDAPAADPNLPSIFTALQEQLGLRLESARGPVEVLVIDRVEPPTED
jgi:uncharacterized protein (TIGR03435 family)